MSPLYLNPQHSSSMPFLELKGDQHNHSLTLVGHLHDHVTSNNAYFLQSNLENHHASAGIQAMDFEYSRRAQEIKVEKLVLSQVKPNDLGQILPSPQQQLQYATDGSGCSYNCPFDRHRDHQIGSVNCSDQANKSKKCKPTKLRIMQKMTTTSKTKITARDHKLYHDLAAQPQPNMYRNTSFNGLRVCTDCHTTTTPLWRSGPQGPKSLCNACGIRQRKARRAAMAAAAAAELANNATAAAASPMSSSCHVEDPKPKVEEIKSEIKLDNYTHDRSHTLPIKKRSKMTDNAAWSYNNNQGSHSNNNRDRLSFGDVALSSSSRNYSQRAFPRDEEEGAILLMALSCGLACSS